MPGRHLRDNGPGFFLLSFGVDDLARAMDALERRGAEFDGGGPRDGVQGWRIADLSPAQWFGMQLQLTEDPAAMAK